MGQFEIITGDITCMDTDAIVNAANSELIPGKGVDGAIHRAAGSELAQECQNLGGCPTGQARITKGYRLKARYVIHTVGPIWTGGENQEEEKLRECYLSCLRLAQKYGIKTIAFPSVSTGAYHFPVNRAAEIAIDAIMSYLNENEGIEKVWFVCHDERTAIVYHIAYDQYIAKR